MNQELHTKFLSLLEASKSFQLLTPEQQAEIRANYADATDEQLERGVEALERDKIVTANLEVERQKNAEALTQHIQGIKTTLREIKRDERVEAEKEDRVSEKKEEDALLHEIDAMSEKKEEVAPEKKRKKFLGIF